jgi:hypothetical protein
LCANIEIIGLVISNRSLTTYRCQNSLSSISDEQIRKLQWSLYKDDNRAYPAIEDGHVGFNKHPPAREPTTPPPGHVCGTLPPCPMTEEIIKSVDWSNWAAMDIRMVEEGSEHAN